MTSGTRLVIGGLPMCLEDASVRLEATDGVVLSDAAVLLDVASRLNSDRPDERIERKLTAKMDGLEARIGAITTALDALTTIEPKPRPPGPEGEAPRPIDLGARLALIELKRKTMARLGEERRTLETELRALSEERAQMRERRSTASEPPERGELQKVVVATVRGEIPEGFQVALEYFVPLARWAPCYLLHVDERERRVRLEIRASAWQRTGEDYRNVAVSFSSARVDRRSELVELQSLRIGRAQAPSTKRMWRPVERDPAELFADYARATRPNVPPAPEPVPAAEAPIDQLLREEGAFEQDLPAAAFAFQAPQPLLAAPPRQQAYGGAPRMERRARVSTKSADVPSPDRPAPRRAKEKPPAPTELAVDERLLAYGDLRMPPLEARVGKLRATTGRERWREDAGRPAIEAEARDAFLSRAESALGAPLSALPPRHVEPEPLEGFDSIYEGTSRVDLASNDVPATLPVCTVEGALSILHVAVPRESQEVFRVLELDNGLAGPVLRGPCDVYFDGRMLTTIDLPAVPPGGKLRAGLGVDSAVKCARNTTYQEATSGLMGGTLSLSHAIRIEVINHRSAPIDLEVRERVPFAPEREEDVKVEIVSVSPEWKPYRPLDADAPVRGAHAWRVAVGASKKAVFEASYAIRLPSKLELVGGNRRE